MLLLPRPPQAFTRSLKKTLDVLEAHAEAIGRAHEFLPTVVKLQMNAQALRGRGDGIVTDSRTRRTSFSASRKGMPTVSW